MNTTQLFEGLKKKEPTNLKTELINRIEEIGDTLSPLRYLLLNYKNEGSLVFEDNDMHRLGNLLSIQLETLNELHSLVELHVEGDYISKYQKFH